MHPPKAVPLHAPPSVTAPQAHRLPQPALSCHRPCSTAPPVVCPPPQVTALMITGSSFKTQFQLTPRSLPSPLPPRQATCLSTAVTDTTTLSPPDTHVEAKDHAIPSPVPAWEVPVKQKTQTLPPATRCLFLLEWGPWISPHHEVKE